MRTPTPESEIDVPDTDRPGTAEPAQAAPGNAPPAGPGARLLAALGRYGRTWSLPGLAGAALLFAAALSPALTPRSAVFQGAAAGVCLAIGYGLGVLVAWVLRRLGARPSPAARRRGRWTLAVGAPAIVLAALVMSWSWQRELRDLMGMEQPASAGSVTTLAVAVALGWLLVQAARGVRWVYRKVAGLFTRVVPAVPARVVAAVLVAWLGVWLVNGTLVDAVLDTMEATSALADSQTFEGDEPPTVAERSGSPQSLSHWDTLGRQGRAFVAGGPDAAEIARVAAATGHVGEVKEPIRVYAGLGAADTVQGVADLVLAELDRTEAWDREVLVLVTTTGSGWVDPPAAAAIELAWGGDTAVAAMQYSYLPSWVSFVGDRTAPAEAGQILLETVWERWSRLPEDERPALYVFGISLGAFGSQGAFSGLQDVTQRVDGAVWAGTPGFTPLWRSLTDARDPGALEVAPVVDGGSTARFGLDLLGEGSLWALGEEWDHPRVVFLQHASDGVTWWSPDLLVTRPDWLREPRGADVLDSVRWYPVATFWALTIDLFVAGEAPDGYGHNFRLEYADAWTAVAPPPGWSEADTLVLREALADV